MIEPRTVSVSVEITDCDFPIAQVKNIMKRAVTEEMLGRVRTVQVNVIQGSRKKARKK